MYFNIWHYLCSGKREISFRINNFFRVSIHGGTQKIKWRQKWRKQTTQSRCFSISSSDTRQWRREQLVSLCKWNSTSWWARPTAKAFIVNNQIMYSKKKGCSALHPFLFIIRTSGTSCPWAAIFRRTMLRHQLVGIRTCMLPIHPASKFLYHYIFHKNSMCMNLIKN